MMTRDSALIEYLKILAPYIGMTLRVDEHGVCRLRLREGLSIEISSTLNEGFRVVALLAELPAGRFRQQVMTAALRFNGGSPPPWSTLAYTVKHSRLILQLELPPGSGEELVRTRFTEFLELAVQWQDSLKAGGGFPEPAAKLPSMLDQGRRLP
jgi:hypothetical protein